MSYLIVRVLEPAAAQAMAEALASQVFVDGRATATGIAAAAKNNLQWSRTGPDVSSLDDTVLNALRGNELLQAFAYPKQIALPTFARYEPGMEYGPHVDAALMGQMRADLAVTLFLNAPGSYDGGELVMDDATEIKLDAGEAIVYPATSIHRVARVSRGERLVAVTWVQSAVRDARMREILYDLAVGISLALPTVDSQAKLLLGKCHQNLLRMAVEP